MWNDMGLNEYEDNELLDIIKNKKVVVYGASSRIQKYINGILKNKVAYIVDGDVSKDGGKVGDISIHTLQYLGNEKDKENIVVLTVLKCISLIDYNLKNIGIEAWYYEKYRGIGAHQGYDKYKQYKEAHTFEIHNEKVMEQNYSYDYIDYIYDGKFVENISRIIKRYSKEKKHLLIVHCLDYLNENDSNDMWEKYLQSDNILVLDDVYDQIPISVQRFIADKMDNAKKIIFHSGVFTRKMTSIVKKVGSDHHRKMCCILHGAEMQYTTNSEFYSEIVEKCDKVYIGSKKRNPFSVYNLSKEQVSCINIDYSDALFIDQGKKHEGINILLGFSATKLCDHKYAISLIEKFKEENIKVFCPLNYSVESMEYVQEVKEYGKQNLGRKFIPIVDFMSLEKYEEFLSDIDVGIFPNVKQCGWTTLAGLYHAGKKIYCSNIMLEVAKERNFTVHHLDELKKESFKEFSKKETYQKNAEYKNGWKKIYN